MRGWVPGPCDHQTCVFCRLFVFFQAEDGIRDYKVTGVQTCALPISILSRAANFPLFGTKPPARSFVHARLTFSRISLALAVQRYGLGLRLCSSMYSRMACCNSATL